MTLPLAVRLDGPQGSRSITKLVTGLTFGSIDPGGYAYVEFGLTRGIDAKLLAEYSDVLVFDTETGEQVGGGRLDEQGRLVDASQKVWRITAVGEGLASMQDRAEPYFLIDLSHDQWSIINVNRKAMDAGSGTAPRGANDNQALVMEHADGPVSIASGLVLGHTGAATCGQLLGGFSYRHDDGQNTPSWRVKARAYSTGYGSNEISLDDGWSTTMSDRRYVTAAATAPTPGTGRFDGTVRTVAAIHWLYEGTGMTASENTWSAAYYPCVLAQRKTRFGNPVYGSPYETTSLFAQDAFIDVVGRKAPRLDIANATVASGIAPLTQLAWYDGVDPLGVMEDVLEQEQALTWHAWNKQQNGLWEVELVELDERPRYDATIRGGLDAPSPSSEVFNEVVVIGTTAQGRINSRRLTQEVPALDARGIVRSRTIDLGSELWSSDAAERVGRKFLDEHRVAPSAGVLTVDREVFDTFTGRWVPPYRIRAGELIHYRGGYAPEDSLGTLGSNGTTVSRIVAADYSEAAGVAQLQLDDYELTERRALTDLMKARNRWKRWSR